ncbi:DUF975 family protein [uncultured Clostridium sp.]|uniref:DUF975 family protein n=1 Tax=uncultured Clostridium sp. TaxID=59620 RepID=UPI0025DE3198|nr:DUF975 family protein [uncultured Clostridium sp.]
MLNAKEFRKIARDSLAGRWPVAIGTGVVAALLGGSVSNNRYSGNSFNFRANSFDIQELFQTDFGRVMLKVIIALAVIFAIWFIVSIVIGGAVKLGYSKFNLNLVDKKEVCFADLFSQFDRIGAGFCMKFLMGLYTLLWTLLFIIPGIIASFSYAMTPYIMAEHPEYKVNEAIGYSKEMMKGNKWRLFCLNFSFIGWSILCIFTLGIGLLWLFPYIEAANAAFYREVSSTLEDKKYI